MEPLGTGASAEGPKGPRCEYTVFCLKKLGINAMQSDLKFQLKGQLDGTTEYINIYLKQPRKLFGYVMRPGEEIYVIHTWFPNETPKPLEFPDEQGFYDVVVSYVDIVDERKKDCEDAGFPKTTNSKLTPA